MRKTRGFFSWALTSVLTVVSAFGIVALTSGNTVASSAGSSTTATTATTATAASLATPTAHVVSVSFHDDSSGTNALGDH